MSTPTNAHRIRGHMDQMRRAGRDVWADADLASVKSGVAAFKDSLASLQGMYARDASDLREWEAALKAEREDLGQKQAMVAAKFADGPTPSPAGQSVAVPEPLEASATAFCLRAAVDLFTNTLDHRSVAANHKKRMRQLFGDLKHCPEDSTLAEVDRVWLQTLPDEINSRPKSRKRRTPLAPYTVRNVLRAWYQFFDWLDANAESPKFGGWQAPRRWQDLFEVKLTKLMNKAERDAHADGPKQLTLDQVVKLYQAVRNDRHRIWVSPGVFATLGQEGISSLRREEFDLDASTLKHHRSKTGQLGRCWLPPEVVRLIKNYFATAPTVRGEAHNSVQCPAPCSLPLCAVPGPNAPYNAGTPGLTPVPSVARSNF